ncbi:AraC family transcriptional regulator [Variovorax sp. J2P1-59]|uniref:AraC family transcriptional regulator n=1 Tax=Variovorax flavidus TaxID=3053501 RepID=UPI002578AD3F|nr:AraC family transcriptional regulator [Variovorax sp. J2P1-59]MDM0073762.1 AraC family transcriptional regulator [Variovorax sp. J2P1-59]
MALEHVHTRDLAEAIETVGQIYCEHRLSLDRRASGIDTTLDVSGAARQPIVRLRYGAAVNVDAGNFPDLYLIMRCTDGSGRVRQGRREADWHPGVTVPVSANVGTDFGFGAEFSQATIKADKQKLDSLCGAMLGRQLEDTLRFELRPFSASLERTWSSTLDLLESTAAAPLPPMAEAALQEFVLTLLLEGHPHNYSDELARRPDRMSSRLVKRAELFMRDHAHEPLTVADVARELGVSIRGLQAGFQSCRNYTPTAFLRSIRMHRARQGLLEADVCTTVTDVAIRNGFLHLGRFSALYKTCFGESPMQTLARSRAAEGRV